MPLCVPFGVSVFSLSRFLYRVHHIGSRVSPNANRRLFTAKT